MSANQWNNMNRPHWVSKEPKDHGWNRITEDNKIDGRMLLHKEIIEIQWYDGTRTTEKVSMYEFPTIFMDGPIPKWRSMATIIVVNHGTFVKTALKDIDVWVRATTLPKAS